MSDFIFTDEEWAEIEKRAAQIGEWNNGLKQAVKEATIKKWGEEDVQKV